MKILTLLAVLLVLSLGTSVGENHDWFLARTLTLKFDYAARQGRPLSTSRFSIIWNGRTVANIDPSNYIINSYSLTLYAQSGWNKIRFVGRGGSDSYGAAITNVKLLRPSPFNDGVEDLIKNGDFHQGHRLTTGWQVFENGVTGWAGKYVQIGHGPIYSSYWSAGTYVCELDSNGRSSGPYQEFHLDGYYRKSKELQIQHPENPSAPQTFLSNRLNLRFNYAAQDKMPYATSQLLVYWNGKLIAHITPRDYSINHASYSVVAKKGNNYLKFVGAGDSDGHGATIGHVKLIRNDQNLILNGDFSHPTIGKQSKLYDSIPGWEGKPVQLGWGMLFNYRWSSDTMVCKLDAQKNTEMMQIIRFDRNYHVD